MPPTPLLTLALGLAARSAILEAAGLTCDIRWPNDLMLGGKKVAGILVQAADGKAVAGIGINVNQTAFPPDLKNEATSLRLEWGRPPGLPTAGQEACPTKILLALLPAIDAFVLRDAHAILHLFAGASSYAAGRRVTVRQPDGAVEGTTAGLDPSGFLIVRKDDGTDTLVLAGGVRAAGS
jgi:BirA family biotin operon repressor/biotin-[acetyl-CoA-carboxylase] ligase